MWHLLHYQLLHDSVPLLPLTATHPPIPCSHHPAHRNRGKLKHDTVCVMWASVCAFATCAWWQVEYVCYWPLITCAYKAKFLIGNLCLSFTPLTQVKRISSFFKESVFSWFTLPKGDQTPRCPQFPIKIHVTVTFCSMREWFISCMYGAAFVFLSLMFRFLECM